MHDRGGQRDITTGVALAEAEAVTARKQREEQLTRNELWMSFNYCSQISARTLPEKVMNK